MGARPERGGCEVGQMENGSRAVADRKRINTILTHSMRDARAENRRALAAALHWTASLANLISSSRCYLFGSFHFFSLVFLLYQKGLPFFFDVCFVHSPPSSPFFLPFLSSSACSRSTSAF